MRKFKYISSFILIVILAVSIKITGCEQEDLDFYIDCFDCLDTQPDSASLIVYVTINEENSFVPLVLYEGDYEDNVVVRVDTFDLDTIYLYAEMGMQYSIKASYIKDGEPLIAIDGDKLRVVDGEGECYPPCYVIRGGTLDLRLK
jgi:hypothetical protein